MSLREKVSRWIGSRCEGTRNRPQLWCIHAFTLSHTKGSRSDPWDSILRTVWKQSAGWVIGLAFFAGSGSGTSGQHLGLQSAVVVRLLSRKTVVKFGGEKIDGGLISFSAVGMANVVKSKEEAKQMVKARDSIETSIAMLKINVHVCESSIENRQRTKQIPP